MRDEKWLFSKLDEVWDTYFSDVPQDNDVQIVWGRRARGRLGSIKQVRGERCEGARDKEISHFVSLNSNLKPHPSNLGSHLVTVITINSLFKDEAIPEYVVTGTIAHELAHYAHGFHSPLEQKFATPHAGGVVHKEMDQRGLETIRRKQHKWLKENWREYLEQNLPRKKPRVRYKIRWI
jgi:hypothetical protein